MQDNLNIVKTLLIIQEKIGHVWSDYETYSPHAEGYTRERLMELKKNWQDRQFQLVKRITTDETIES